MVFHSFRWAENISLLNELNYIFNVQVRMATMCFRRMRAVAATAKNLIGKSESNRWHGICFVLANLEIYAIELYICFKIDFTVLRQISAIANTVHAKWAQPNANGYVSDIYYTESRARCQVRAMQAKTSLHFHLLTFRLHFRRTQSVRYNPKSRRLFSPCVANDAKTKFIFNCAKQKAHCQRRCSSLSTMLSMRCGGNDGNAVRP